MPPGSTAISTMASDSAERHLKIDPKVSEVYIASGPEDRALRGVKGQLRSLKRKMNAKEFHEYHGHLGYHPGCLICAMSKKTLRRITKPVNPHKETRVGYSWSMDTIQMSDHALCKSKWLIVLKCNASSYYQLLPIAHKHEAPNAVSRWIRVLRADPRTCKDVIGYDMVQHIKTDQAGEWFTSEKWKSTIGTTDNKHNGYVGSLGVEMEYVSPDTHKQNPAERACGIVEQTIKSILMQSNLPPSWWARAACDAEFLLNRFPVAGAGILDPLDGDKVRPLEAFTNFWYSRNQINREIHYYVPVGTPTLVYLPRAKGSSLSPKVRWGIAAGMTRETVKFVCPFTQDEFQSKSFTAYKLRQGINYAQFLGLKSIGTTQRHAASSDDVDERVVLQLPPMKETSLRAEEAPIKLYEPDQFGQHDEEGAEDEQRDSPTSALQDDQVLQGLEHSADTHVGDSTPVQTTPIANEQIGTVRYKQSGGPPNVNKSASRQDAHLPPRKRDKYVRCDDKLPSMHSDVNIATQNLQTNTCADSQHIPSDIMGKHDVKGKSDILITTRNAGTPASVDITLPSSSARPNDGHSTDIALSDTPPSILSNDKITPEMAKVISDAPARKVGQHGGHIQIVDKNFVPMQILPDGTVDYPPASVQTTPAPTDEQVAGWDSTMSVNLEPMVDVLGVSQADWDQAERNTMESRSRTFNVESEGITWGRILKHHKIPTKLHEPYRQWMIHHSPECDSITPADIPVTRGQYLTIGMKFPYPTGNNWHVICDGIEGGHEARLNPRRAMRTEYLRMRKHRGHREAVHRAHRTRALEAMCKENSTKPIPKTLKDAFQTEDAEGWAAAADLEFNTLTSMGVISHNHTLDELQCKFGIETSPINMRVVLDNKYKDGVFERHKVRMCVAGHKYNMQKGVHYDDVFSPAPNQNVARVLGAMTADMDLKRKSWDISLAYCWADLPPGKLIALRYPKGYERKCPKTSQEMYMILRKNCYGHPAAAKAWGDHRDAFLMETFNKNGWKIHKCTYDPCLFYIQRGIHEEPPSKTGIFFKGGHLDRRYRPADEEAWVSIHTDDCDAYGTTQKILNDIYSIINDKWKSKLCDSDFMLGVKRTYTNRDGIRKYHMTMTAYVEGMYETFKDEMTSHEPRTPFPHGLSLHKSDCESDEESQEILDKGYMKIVGMLLWCARGVYPECSAGMHELSKVASRPSYLAWGSAVKMVKWMYAQRYRGITFTNTGNDSPIVFSDASNKPDPNDGLCKFGHCVMMKGGPVATCSKKLPHVGLSAFHNEYMALRYAASPAMWLRQLLPEIGCSHYVKEPTILYGDNTAANGLTSKDFISTGNQHIYVPYHYIKELVKNKNIRVEYKPTKINLSDLFTKSVSPQTMEALLHYMTGQDPSWQYHVEAKDAPEYASMSAKVMQSNAEWVHQCSIDEWNWSCPYMHSSIMSIG